MSTFKEKKGELFERVEELRDFSKELDDENIVNSLEEFREEVKDGLTFNVLCLGDFSSGKSTFINQFFINKPTLPTNVATTTARLTIIKYGENEKIRLKFKDGTTEDILDNFENVLSDFVAKDGEKIEKIDIVEVYINSDFLKEGVVIVDSPGLNDPEVERMNVTLDYIKNADSILYLLTAMSAWKKSEKDFLEEKILRKEDLDKIFFLLNYWDVIENDNDRSDVVNFVKQQMGISLKKVSAEIGKELSLPPVVPISAKTKENFDLLHTELWDYLGSKKGEDIIIQKYKKLDAFKSYIRELLEEKIEVQKKEAIELTDTLEELKQEVNDYKEDVDLFRERLDDRVSMAVDEWTEEVKDYYNTLKDKIIMKISKQIANISEEEVLTNAIRSNIQKVTFLEEDTLNGKNKDLIQKIEEVAKDERAKLELNQYFIKNNILKSDKLSRQMKDEIIPEIKIDYTRDMMITGASVAGAVFAATIYPPLALLGVAGLIYNAIDKKDVEKKEILKQMPIIEEQIEEVITININNIFARKDEIVDEVLSTIKNDVVDAYDEKLKIYDDALKNKESNKDDEVILDFQEKIERLENL